MPVKQTVYDLQGPGGKAVAMDVFAVQAREHLASDPERFTLRRPEGVEIVARDGSVPLPEEPLSDEERKAAQDEAAKRGYEAALGSAFLPEETIVRGTTSGAGTIKDGYDLTRSTGMELTKRDVNEFNLANQYPEAAEKAAEEGRPLQPLQQENTEGEPPPEDEPRRARRKG